MNIIARTSRFYIREFEASELHLILAIDADDRLTQYVKKRTPDESKKVFKDTLRDYASGSGLGRWGVFNVADDDFIGVCILKTSDYDSQCIELGYRLHLKYWGQGIATEIVNAITGYGFGKAGLTEICAVTHPKNAASQKVLEKARFIKQGTVFWYEEEVPFFKLTS